jgi:small subunit ribosomal protein S16
MLKIRLMRVGRKNLALYRIVVADARRAQQKKYIEKIGNYDPHKPDPQDKVIINKERLDYWLSIGAKITKNLASILVHSKKISPEQMKKYSA